MWVLVIMILASGKTLDGPRYRTLEDCALALKSFRESNPGMRFWCQEREGK